MTAGMAKINGIERWAISIFDCYFPDLSAFLRNLCILPSVYVFILSFIHCIHLYSASSSGTTQKRT